MPTSDATTRTFSLRSEHERSNVPLVLRPMTADDLDRFEKEWQPKLRESKQKDAEWPWRREFERDAEDPEVEMYVIADESGRLRGLMTLRARLLSRKNPGRELVYTERIAIEPESRIAQKPMRELLGLGSALLAHAVQRSIDRGLGGRVGLHALEDPNTEVFYKRAGMDPMFRDPDGNELYFEFSDEAAQAFLEKVYAAP